MNFRALGFAMSRVMAIVVVLQMLSDTLIRIAMLQFSLAGFRSAGLSFSDWLLILFPGALGCYLWFRPQAFAGESTDPEEAKTEAVNAKTIFDAMLIGPGVYFMIAGIVGLCLTNSLGRSYVEPMFGLPISAYIFARLLQVACGLTLCVVSIRRNAI